MPAAHFIGRLEVGYESHKQTVLKGLPFMSVKLFVNGTLMRGLPLHSNLEGAEFLGNYRTTPRYRIYSINDIHPGMFELNDGEEGGVSVAGEIYRMSDEIWSRVERGEPPHLYKGIVKLVDGNTVDGILFPRDVAEDPINSYINISFYGDWRKYLESKNKI